MTCRLTEAGPWTCSIIFVLEEIYNRNVHPDRLFNDLFSLHQHFPLIHDGFPLLWNSGETTPERSPHRNSRFPSPETSKNIVLSPVISEPRASTPYPRRKSSFIIATSSFSLTRKSKINCFPSYSHEKVGQSKRTNRHPNAFIDSKLSENGELANKFSNIATQNDTNKEVLASSNSLPSSKLSNTHPASQNQETTNW